MTPLRDRARIRAILETDRNWSAYALADLEPGYFEHSSWFVSTASASATVLVYSEFEMPVVLALGAAADLSPILEELSEFLRKQRTIYFVIRPEILPLLKNDYIASDRRPMVRMVLEANRFPAGDQGRVDRLQPADLDAVMTLYDDGAPAGETPDFFIPRMLANGVYYGVREGADLVAVAGTHVCAPGEGVGGLGNIYTRRDRRRQGLAARVTGAVTSELLRRNFPTIVLNVNEANSPAIRVYEKLGFREYCRYFEIIASPRG